MALGTAVVSLENEHIARRRRRPGVAELSVHRALLGHAQSAAQDSLSPHGIHKPNLGSAAAAAAMALRSVALASCLLLLHAPQSVSAHEIVTITDENFAEYSGKDFMLLEFYAPWCGHCKKLKPAYEKAAAALKQSLPEVVIAQCDATEESGVAGKHDVRGYPTLKWFRAGEVSEYTGERSEAGIIAWVTRKAEPAVAALVDVAAIASFKAKTEVAVVFYGTKEDPSFAAFEAAAGVAPDDVLYGLAEPVLVPEGVEAPAAVLYRRFASDEPPASLAAKALTEQRCKEWVAVEGLPAILEFTQANMPKIFQDRAESGLQLLHVLLFSDSTAAYHEGAKAAMAAAYQQYKGEAINVLVDAAAAADSKRCAAIAAAQSTAELQSTRRLALLPTSNKRPLHSGCWTTSPSNGRLCRSCERLPKMQTRSSSR